MVVILASLIVIMAPIKAMLKKKKNSNSLVSKKQELLARGAFEDQLIVPLYLSSLSQAFGLEFNDFFALLVTPITRHEFSIEDIVRLENANANRNNVPVPEHHKNLSPKIFDMIFENDDYLKMCIDNLTVNRELNGGFFTTIRDDVVNKLNQKKKQESRQLLKTVLTVSYPLLFAINSSIGIYYSARSLLNNTTNQTANIALLSSSLAVLGVSLFDIGRKLNIGYMIMKKIGFYRQLHETYQNSVDSAEEITDTGSD